MLSTRPSERRIGPDSDYDCCLAGRWLRAVGVCLRSRVVLLLALLALVALIVLAVPTIGRAQQPPAAESTEPAANQVIESDDSSPQPIFRAGIHYVRVDAIITDDDDNPILDLGVDEFEIFEDGIKQEIESLELIQVSGRLDPALPPPSSIRNEYDEIREAARSDSRIFAFFLDDYHVREGNAMRLTGPLIEFIETRLRPTDLIAIMYPLTPLIDVRLTRNHAQIVSALEGFRGRKYDYIPVNTYEMTYAHYPTETVERIRNDVSLSALKALAMRLGGLREGRKSIIVLSEGYTDYVPPQLRDVSADGGQRSFQRYDPFAGQNPYEQTQQFFSDAGMRMNLLYTAEIANRNNTSLYMVDPRGLAAFEYDMSTAPIIAETDRRILRNLQDTLHILAEETDGRAIVNRNDVGPGLEQIVADASSYYLLGYTSSEAPTDGEFHEIELRVNRSDAKVRARKGYYALTEQNARRVLTPSAPEPPKAFETALSALAEPVRGRLVRTWVGARRGDRGKTKMTFVWEPTGDDQGRQGESASQVMLMAMSDSSAYFRGDLPASGRASGPRAEFDADPGDLELNFAVEDEYGDVLDRGIEELTVPDFTSPDLTLSTPHVHRAHNAQDLRRIVADSEALPTATRFFRRTDQLVLRGEVYAPGDVPVDVTAQLLSRQGTQMLEIPVEQTEANGMYQLVLQLSPFPRGDYVIEISAEAESVSGAMSLVAFRVQGS